MEHTALSTCSILYIRRCGGLRRWWGLRRCGGHKKVWWSGGLVVSVPAIKIHVPESSVLSGGRSHWNTVQITLGLYIYKLSHLLQVVAVCRAPCGWASPSVAEPDLSHQCPSPPTGSSAFLAQPTVHTTFLKKHKSSQSQCSKELRSWYFLGGL